MIIVIITILSPFTSATVIIIILNLDFTTTSYPSASPSDPHAHPLAHAHPHRHANPHIHRYPHPTITLPLSTSIPIPRYTPKPSNTLPQTLT